MSELLLNVGSGGHILPGYTNVDRVSILGVDVVHDLDVHPWPFDAGSVHLINASHVFEHLEDPVGFMVEAHRVLAPGGAIRIAVPHYQSRNAFTDPTHRRFCTEETFDYWTIGTQLHSQYNGSYGGVSFNRTWFEHLVVPDERRDDLVFELEKA